MNFPTLPYDNVTDSFLLEKWFWGPTHPAFLYDVTLFSLFFFEVFPKTYFFTQLYCLLKYNHWLQIQLKLLLNNVENEKQILNSKEIVEYTEID